MVVSYVNAWPIHQAKCWSIFICCQIAKLDDVRWMYHSYGIGTNVHGKILDSENFANLMNDAQICQKFFPTILENTVKLLLKICHQIHQNIPHYLLYLQQFLPKFNPSIFPTSRNKPCFSWQIYMHWVNGKAMSMQIMYGASSLLILTDNCGFIRPLMRISIAWLIDDKNCVSLSPSFMCTNELYYCVLFLQCCSVSDIVNKFSVLKYL